MDTGVHRPIGLADGYRCESVRWSGRWIQVWTNTHCPMIWGLSVKSTAVTINIHQVLYLTFKKICCRNRTVIPVRRLSHTSWSSAGSTEPSLMVGHMSRVICRVHGTISNGRSYVMCHLQGPQNPLLSVGRMSRVICRSTEPSLMIVHVSSEWSTEPSLMVGHMSCVICRSMEPSLMVGHMSRVICRSMEPSLMVGYMSHHLQGPRNHL